jgi:hypothetical protein
MAIEGWRARGDSNKMDMLRNGWNTMRQKNNPPPQPRPPRIIKIQTYDSWLLEQEAVFGVTRRHDAEYDTFEQEMRRRWDEGYVDWFEDMMDFFGMSKEDPDYTDWVFYISTDGWERRHMMSQEEILDTWNKQRQNPRPPQVRPSMPYDTWLREQESIFAEFLEAGYVDMATFNEEMQKRWDAGYVDWFNDMMDFFGIYRTDPDYKEWALGMATDGWERRHTTTPEEMRDSWNKQRQNPHPSQRAPGNR